MFLCSCGENVAKKLFLFLSIYRSKLVPSAFFCSNPGITILPRPRLFFSTIQAKHNSQINNVLLSGITRGVGMRLVTSCPASRQDIGPFEDLSVLTKFSLVQQVVRTCFCDCLTKCIARATRTNHTSKTTTASLFS